MANFDGTNYIGLDSQAPGDGTGDNTHPGDTLLEFGLKNCEEYLAKRRPGRNFAPYAGNRVVTSQRESTWWRCHYPISRSTDTLRAILVGNVDGTSSEGLDVVFEAIVPGRGKLRDEKTLTQTSTDHWTFTLDVDVLDDTIVLLSMRVGRAERHTTRRSTSNAYITAEGKIEVDGDAALQPAKDEVVELTDIGPTVSPVGDINVSNFFRTSAPAYQYERGSGDLTGAEVGQVAHLNPDSLVIEEDFNDDRTDLKPKQLTHRQPYEAQWSAFRHATTQRRQYSEQRPVSLGYSGDAHDNWSGHTTRWGHFRGDEGTKTIFSDSIKVDRTSNSSDNTSVRFVWSGIGLLLSTRRIGMDDEATLETLENASSELTLDLTYTVEQLQAGSGWSGAKQIAQSTAELDLTAWPTDETGRWPILQTMRWYYLDGTGANRNLGAVGPVPQEGQLFAADRNLTKRRITESLALSDYDQTLPMRATIEASLNSTDAASDSDVAAALLNCTILELPQ